MSESAEWCRSKWILTPSSLACSVVLAKIKTMSDGSCAHNELPHLLISTIQDHKLRLTHHLLRTDGDHVCGSRKHDIHLPLQSGANITTQLPCFAMLMSLPNVAALDNKVLTYSTLFRPHKAIFLFLVLQVN